MLRYIIPSLALVAGCAGDYVVYRVAYEAEEYTADCYPDGQVPADIVGDATTFLTSDTFAVFHGPEGVLYLELGAVTLDGEKESGVTTFSGESVDVEPLGGDATVTQLSTVVVTMEGGGAQVSGQVETDVQVTCAGADCPEEASSSCTVTAAYVGTRVDGVQLTHEL